MIVLKAETNAQMEKFLVMNASEKIRTSKTCHFGFFIARDDFNMSSQRKKVVVRLKLINSCVYFGYQLKFSGVPIRTFSFFSTNTLRCHLIYQLLYDFFCTCIFIQSY